MKSKIDLKTNAKYRPPYSYKKLFDYVNYFFIAPKNGKFLALPVNEENVANKLKKDFNFDYSKPDIDFSEFIEPIQQLQSTKIDIYKKNYPFHEEPDRDKFEYMVSAIGGLISGHSRAFKTMYMMTVLLDFKEKSPNLFNKFSLSQWKLFSNAIFEKAPTKSNLMQLASDKKGTLANYSHLKSQASSKKIIDLLLSDYEKEILLIRSDFKQSCAKFKKQTTAIKKQTDRVINAIKKSQKGT